MERDEFLVVERSYCDDDSTLSVGLANIRAAVPDVEANKDKILRSASIFKERGVNIAVFPEFCLSGYFWDAREDCLAYMKQAVTELHADWIQSELQPLIGGDLEAIVLDNLVTERPNGLTFRFTGGTRLVVTSVAGARDDLVQRTTCRR